MARVVRLGVVDEGVARLAGSLSRRKPEGGDAVDRAACVSTASVAVRRVSLDGSERLKTTAALQVPVGCGVADAGFSRDAGGAGLKKSLTLRPLFFGGFMAASVTLTRR